MDWRVPGPVAGADEKEGGAKHPSISLATQHTAEAHAVAPVALGIMGAVRT